MAGRNASELAKTVVRTSGQAFPDGLISELVRSSSGEVELLIWDGKSAQITGQFVRDGKIFVPLRLDPTILRSLQLPSKTLEYGSTRKLFTEIFGLISRATQGANSLSELLTLVVFATWRSKSLPLAPYVWIVTPPTTNWAPVAQLLKLLCRRALMVHEISLRGLRVLPMELQPTLLTEVFEPTRRMLHLLRASTRRGALIEAGGKAVDAGCPIIVFAPEPLRDPASAGFPLELVLPPTREYIPPMDPSEAERIASKYQPMLLYYQLLNSTVRRAPTFDVSQFTVAMQQLAYSLAASIVDDDELQARIVPLLKPLDSEIQVRYTSFLPAIVSEVLLSRCHTTTGNNFPVTDMTVDVNTVLRGRGEELQVSPEAVGWTLRGLGLHTDFTSGGRKALVLSSGARGRVHQLAAAYGVRTLRELPEKIKCQLCAELKLPWRTTGMLGPRLAHRGGC